MGIEFVPAVREKTRLIICIIGPTGGGKSGSALRISRGLAAHIGEDLNDPATLAKIDARIKAIDTENGRLLFFAPAKDQKLGKGIFGFRHGNMRPPFSPNAYREAIEEGSQGCEVLMIDSFSHEWDGDGGQHDMQSEALEKMLARNPNLSEESVSSLAWKTPKMDHRRLVSKLLQVAPFIVLCLRAEDKLLIQKVPVNPNFPNGQKKTIFVGPMDRELKDRWIPICDKRFPFEVTMSLLVVPEKPGVPIPVKLNEEHKFAVPLDRQISEATGRMLRDWSDGIQPGETPAPEPAAVPEDAPEGWDGWGNEQRGLNRAAKGTAALAKWWESLSKEERVALKAHLPEWKEIAERKDVRP